MEVDVGGKEQSQAPPKSVPSVAWREREMDMEMEMDGG